MSHRVALALLTLALFTTAAVGQELAPRAYWPAPKGTKVISLGYGYTNGDVLLDPVVPVEGVDNESHSLALSYYQTFGLAGRTAAFTITQPGARSRISADLGSEEVSRSVSGPSDLQLRLSLNFLGAPAMTPQEFQQFIEAPPSGIFGASLKIQLPTGEYNNDRVANIGSSRFAIKPELGYIFGLGSGSRWGLETALGAWIYGDNNDFLGDRLEQKPMVSAEIHLVHLLSRGSWLSLDMNFYRGGQTTRAGDPKDNRQQNSRYGATFVFSVAKQHLLKVAFSNSWRIEEGGDYSTVALAYSFAWN